MAVGEEKRLISREPSGRGAGRERWMRGGPGGGDKGAELGEREQEKFTGEWVDATRPSNRRLDYSAQHIACGYVYEYVCEAVRARACMCLYSFFFMYPSSQPGISSIFILLSLSPAPSHLALSASPSFFFFPFPVPEEHRSRSLTLAWIACVNAYPMVNELAVISILESVSRLASPRPRDPRRGCPCKDAGRAIIYLPAIYLPPAPNN